MAWGVVYSLHDFAAMALITMVMIHIYFALQARRMAPDPLHVPGLDDAQGISGSF